MKKLFKTLNGRDIIHSHNNFKRETTFMPTDKKGGILHSYPAIIKANELIDWDNPFTKEELKHLSSED